MLTVKVLEEEHFDEEKNMFFAEVVAVLELEHSLVSLSKWESKHEKPFLGGANKTDEEVMDYIRAMLLTPDVPPEVLGRLSQKNFDEINNYIDAKMTATWFHDMPNAPKSRETITAELIYYWMIGFNIPWEAQHWHLNRLFTLIKICNVKGSKPKKMSRGEIAQRNREENARRKAQMGTSG